VDPGRAYDRGLLSSTFRDRLHEDDDGCRTFGADDVDVYLCRDVFRKIRIQMIDDIAARMMKNTLPAPNLPGAANNYLDMSLARLLGVSGITEIDRAQKACLFI